jgi:hypothetical protein
MCDIATAFAIGSTIVGAAGAKQSADANAAAQNYNAKIQDMNATLAERRARDALDRGQEEEQRKREQAAQILGKQRAAMAANGVDLTFGSPLDTLVSTATLGELDAMTIRKNAANEAYDYRVDAVNNRANATLSRANAKATKTAGNLDALGTILSGGAKAYGSYQDNLGYRGR